MSTARRHAEEIAAQYPNSTDCQRIRWAIISGVSLLIKGYSLYTFNEQVILTRSLIEIRVIKASTRSSSRVHSHLLLNKGRRLKASRIFCVAIVEFSSSWVACREAQVTMLYIRGLCGPIRERVRRLVGSKHGELAVYFVCGSHHQDVSLSTAGTSSNLAQTWHHVFHWTTWARTRGESHNTHKSGIGGGGH
jgi:hypothetical protein